METDTVFPQAVAMGSSLIVSGGLQLRDLFAAAALTGISGHFAGPVKKDDTETPIKAHARWAYAMADEMLKERNK